MAYTKLFWQVYSGNMIYCYNYNCYNGSQQPAVDEVSNTTFLRSSISVLVVLVLSVSLPYYITILYLKKLCAKVVYYARQVIEF